MAQWHSENVIVHPAAALPVAWTDLDLSAYVGHQHALIVLQVQMPAAGGYFSCRRNGETSDFRQFAAGARGAHTYGASMAFVDGGGRYQAVVCETDEDGIIEIISDTGFASELFLVGWVPCFHSGVVVKSATTPPAAWTDIDLKPEIDNHRSLVLLKIEETNGVAGQGVGFRQNGTAWETVPPNSWTAGGSFAELLASGAAYILTWCSAASFVEWKRFVANAATIEVTLECFVPHGTGWHYPPPGEQEVFNGAYPAAFTDLDLTTSTTPAPTGLPAAEVFALAAVHDVLVGTEMWSWREDGSAYDYREIGLGDSSGVSGAMPQVGANNACIVGMSTLAGVVEHDSFWTRVGEVDLLGWVEPFDGLHPPAISREYPAAEQIVAQDTEIRFRLSDDTGIQLDTLQVTLSTVDEKRRLVVDGAWGVDDGVQQATGTMLANEVHGYDLVIHPTAELGDRRWTVTVEVLNADGVELP